MNQHAKIEPAVPTGISPEEWQPEPIWPPCTGCARTTAGAT